MSATARRFGQGTVLIVAAMLLLGGMVVFSLGSRGSADVRARLATFVMEQQRVRAAEPRSTVRTLLYGEPVAEDVAGDYENAAALLVASAFQDSDALLEVGPGRAAARAAAWALLQPVVAALQQATHRRVPGRKVAIEVSRRLESVLCIACEHAADRGAWRECVEAWLDRAAVFLDQRDATWWEHRELVAPWSDERLGQLDPAAERLLAEGLACLDAIWPQWADPVGRLVSQADVHLRTGSSCGIGDPGVRDRLRAWRFGFDLDRMELAAIAHFVQALPALVPPAAARSAREAQWRQFFAGEREWTVTESCLYELREAELALRNELARIRLLRLAIAFRLGEPLPELADPFADRPLQSEVHADRAHFRSAATHAVLQRVAYRR